MIALWDRVKIADFVAVKHKVKDEPAVCRSDKNQVFLAVTHHLSQGGPAGLPHGIAQQPVGLLATLVRCQIVAALKVNRIHFADWNEFAKLDVAVCFGFRDSSSTSVSSMYLPLSIP